MNNHKSIVTTLEASFRSIRALVLLHAGNIQSELKEDGTPQTHIDVEAEHLIRSALTKAHPDLLHFGEESGYSEDLPALCCLIDALDGTKSYLQNEPAFTGMAVIIHENEAVASVIYNYTTDEMYVAIRGEGAYKNGEKLDLSDKALPEIAYCRERMVQEVNVLLHDTDCHVTCEPGPSGAGYGFSLVADGEIAARFNFPHHPGGGHIHDYAPGALLVQEAGGVVLDIEQTKDYTIHSKSFIACHPRLKPLILSVLPRIKEIEISTSQSS